METQKVMFFACFETATGKVPRQEIVTVPKHKRLEEFDRWLTNTAINIRREDSTHKYTYLIACDIID
jgi:hypothetical protein